jgi:hypothetical protein
VFVQLEGVGHHLNAPRALGLVLAHLEADPEVAGVFGHAAEGVDGAVFVRNAVVLEPLLCMRLAEMLGRWWGW